MTKPPNDSEDLGTDRTYHMTPDVFDPMGIVLRIRLLSDSEAEDALTQAMSQSYGAGWDDALENLPYEKTVYTEPSEFIDYLTQKCEHLEKRIVELSASGRDYYYQAKNAERERDEARTKALDDAAIAVLAVYSKASEENVIRQADVLQAIFALKAHSLRNEK